MNPLWLILIIPCSMFAGAFCMALVAVNKSTTLRGEWSWENTGEPYTKPDYLAMIADLQRQIDELKNA